jgi:hypothetical protein
VAIKITGGGGLSTHLIYIFFKFGIMLKRVERLKWGET